MQFFSTTKINSHLLFLIFCFIYSFLISNQVVAQSGKITGIVKEELSGTALPGANCTLIGTSIGSATNLDGDFLISNLKPGSYILKVMYIGYAQKELTVEVKAGSTTYLEIFLKSNAVEIRR